MRTLWGFALVLLVCLWVSPAQAQIHQKGVVTTGHCAQWLGNNEQGDSGAACVGGSGSNFPLGAGYISTVSCDGATDEAAALQTDLNTFAALGGGSYYLSNPSLPCVIGSANLTIPSGVWLVGTWEATVWEVPGASFPSSTISSNTTFNIILSTSHSIVLSSNSGIRGVSIRAQGLTFPTSQRTALNSVEGFSGTGITSLSNAFDFNIEHVFLVGFNTCISLPQNQRVREDWVWGDCTNGEVIDGPNDVGRVNNTHWYPFLTALPQSYTATSAYNIASMTNNGGAYQITTTGSTNFTGTSDTGYVIGTGLSSNSRWNLNVSSPTVMTLTGSTYASGYAPAAFTATVSGSTMVVSACSVCTLALYQNLVGAGIPAGTQIKGGAPIAGGGFGGVGTYVISNGPLTIGSESMSSYGVIRLDTNARAGTGLSVTGGDEMFVTNAFEYGHYISYHAGTSSASGLGSTWFQCVNCGADGTLGNYDPLSIGILVDGATDRPTFTEGVISAKGQSFVINTTSANYVKIANMSLSANISNIFGSVLNGSLQLDNNDVLGSGSAYVADGATVLRVYDTMIPGGYTFQSVGDQPKVLFCDAETSTTILGCAKVDGSTITATAGLISVGPTILNNTGANPTAGQHACFTGTGNNVQPC